MEKKSVLFNQYSSLYTVRVFFKYAVDPSIVVWHLAMMLVHFEHISLFTKLYFGLVETMKEFMQKLLEESQDETVQEFVKESH